MLFDLPLEIYGKQTVPFGEMKSTHGTFFFTLSNLQMFRIVFFVQKSFFTCEPNSLTPNNAYQQLYPCKKMKENLPSCSNVLHIRKHTLQSMMLPKVSAFV